METTPFNGFPYTFKSIDLIEEALTLPSSTQQHHENYQRLEFLGDAVLQLLITEVLYKKHPRADEGELTLMRKNLVSGFAIYDRRARLHRDFHALLAQHNSNYQRRDKAIIDVIEALIGAAWLDGGMPAARKMVFSLISKEDVRNASNIDATESQKNPKGLLQEIVQKHFHIEPKYECRNVEGPRHQPTFTCAAIVNSYEALGTGSSTKLAEAAAAKNLITLLTEQHLLDSP